MTAGEQRVLAEAQSGAPVDLSDLSDQERVVSANVIRRLCVGVEAKGVDPRGVWIRNAHIPEELDLSFCTIAHPLRFEASAFEAIPDLRGADLPALWIVGCSLPGLLGSRIRTRRLRLDSSVTGKVTLIGAEISGSLDCSGATVTSEGGEALVADTAEINGSVLLRGGFSATGEVRLLGAKIGGDLDCSGATLSNEGGRALIADRAVVGDLVLRHGFSATGEVRLPGARIGGDLTCSGAALTNDGGYALLADTAVIAGNVFLDGGFSTTGAVSLLGAKIAGQLDCSGATLNNEGGSALVAETAEINGNVYLREEFSATGAVEMLGIKIAGQLDCSGATLTNEGGNALVADAAEIGGLLLRDGFSATGEVRLPGAKIGSDLDLSGATLSNGHGDALFAKTAEITGSVFLREGFSATGALRLVGAKIGGYFVCVDAILANAAGSALYCLHTTIGAAFIFYGVQTTGGVNLNYSSATTLDDDLGRGNGPLGSWRDVTPLVLDGFTYTRFGEGTEWDSRLRRRWLQHTTEFEHAAWQQLIAVYRAVGRDDEATRTAIAMQNDRASRAGLPWYRVAGRRVLGAVIGHGYRPWRAGIWAVAIIAAFALVVWHWPGMFHPEKQGVTGSPQPVAYAADVFLPIVDLGQADDWTPVGWLRWVEWSVILLGWSLTTIFVAGFTRIVRSE